jgi:hypothetical protein
MPYSHLTGPFHIRSVAPDDTVAIYLEDSKALFEEINPGSKIDGTILV